MTNHELFALYLLLSVIFALLAANLIMTASLHDKVDKLLRGKDDS